VNLEPDYLVCCEGRWGILEVDGPWHPRAAVDSARDREFRRGGLVVERFEAEECWRDPDDVVAQFFRVLRAPR
jgi:very-short-patch-repair endonuclease